MTGAALWVLIYIMIANANVSTATAEFATQARCEQAVEFMKKNWQSAFIQIKAICIRKAEP
jgi:hypothetical protein